MKISVITASYNCSNTIRETIESIINQSHRDWELIIVDDGSSDDSVDIIKSYCEKDDRIKLFTHDNHINKGLKETLLLGLSKAKNEWVQFCECDDLLKENCISEKVKIIEKYSDISLIFSWVEAFGSNSLLSNHSKWLNDSLEILSNENYPANILKKGLKLNIIPSFSCVMCKKSDLLNCSFETPIDAYLDWFLWSQMADKKVYYIPEKLTMWRLSSDSYAQTFEQKDSHLKIDKFYKTIEQNILKKNIILKILDFIILYIKSFFQKIFSLRNSQDKTHKLVTLLGFKIKLARKI